MTKEWATRVGRRARRLAGLSAALALILPGAASASSPPYTVTFDSTEVQHFLGQGGAASGTETNEYTASVPLNLGAGGTFTGASQGSYAQASGTISAPCTSGSMTGTTTETDEGGNPTSFGASVTPASGGAGGSVTVIVGTPPVGFPTENYRDVPGCGGMTTGNTTPRWYSEFVQEHTSALVLPSALTFNFTLSPGSGDTVGTYTSDASFTNGNLMVQESTTITVTESPCIVPGVAGEALASAESALTDVNCAVGPVTQAQSSTVAVGNVISSSPAAGTTLQPETAVALVVSKGMKATPKCKVPNVKGRPLSVAKSALKAAGCSVGKVTKKKSAKVANGRVISTSPPAGAVKSVGAKVSLTVSKTKGCTVPKLKGRKLAAAKKALKAAGCAVGKVTKKKSAKKNKGRVLSQSPRPGARKPARGKVKLTVGK